MGTPPVTADGGSARRALVIAGFAPVVLFALGADSLALAERGLDAQAGEQHRRAALLRAGAARCGRTSG